MHEVNLEDDFSSFAAEVREGVELRLRSLFSDQLRRANRLGGIVPTLVASLRDLTLRGGKRLRAVLVATGFVAVNQEAALQPAIAAGVAFELLQSYFLIHDDWMDGDAVRRGGPSVHVDLASRLGSAKLGDPAAVLAGDFAAALALEELSTARASEPALLAAIRRFALVQAETVTGQVLDLTRDATDDPSPQLEDLKTNSYTVRGPLLVGALLAGAAEPLLDHFVRYAHPVGLAFQLRDDLLGLVGDPSVTGKPRGGDLRAGKRTLPIRDALQHLPSNGRALLLSVLGKREAAEPSVLEAIEWITRSGAIRRTELRIQELCLESAQLLAQAPGLSARGTRYLTALTRRLTERQA